MNRFTAVSICVLSAALFLPQTAQAFCGLYVARAEGSLFNDASKVVIARKGWNTVITMSSDYHGEPSDFAMVVPTPVVLKEDQVRTVEAAVLDRLDAYSAPRLVEYQDDDPCVEYVYIEESSVFLDDAPARIRGPAAFGVKVEAEYAVGGYDIVILSAKQSGGLTAYLLQEGYNIPEGAEGVLADYIRGGMKFFVARVNLERHAAGDGATLTPLQISFEQREFMLPIRLGMVNARGPQDMILMTLSQKGRVGVENYTSHRIHTDVDIPIFVRGRFAEFYRDMFNRSIESIGGTGIVMEYAWDMAWCDPCAADPLSNSELRELGVTWLDGSDENAGQDVYVTRLHARYDASFKEDLMLRESENRENFQGRYVLREPFRGALQCDAGRDYAREVRARTKAEAEILAQLTGWSRRRIREEIAKTVPRRYR